MKEDKKIIIVLTFICPSAVNLKRLHVAQKWSDMLEIKPKTPLCPGTFQDLAVSFNSSETRVTVGWRA